jgi:hypothetical protein
MPFPIYDSQDDIPEAFRGEYEEREGKWHPKVPDVTNLNSALQKERDRAEREEKARKDAEKERDALKRQTGAREKGVTEDQLATLRAEDEAKRKAELEPLQRENQELKTKLRKVTHADRVQKLALDAGVMPDRIEDAMLILVDGPTPRTDLTEDGESIVVKDKKGNITTEKIEAFLETTLRAEKPWLYAGSVASGSDFGRNPDPLPVQPASHSTDRASEHRARAAAAI